MIRTALLVSMLALSAPGQKCVEWWPGTWEEAFKEARQRNVPVFVGINQDGEEANERVATGLYKDPEFIKLSDRAVSIIASIGNHPQVKQEIRGQTLSVCSRFGAIPCMVHKELEISARAVLFENKAVATPHHAVFLPDGKIVARIHDVAGTGAYVDAVHQAQKQLGPGLSADQYRKALGFIEAARQATEEDRLHDALDALAELDKIARGTPVQKQAEPLAKVLENKGRVLLEEVQGLAKQGKHLEALRTLAREIADFKGTPFLKELKDADAALRKTREGKEAAAILAKEEKAQPSFDKAKEFEAQKDYVRSAKEYVKVLAAAPGTPLADAAHTRLHEMANDPDIGPLVASVFSEREADELLKAAQEVLRGGDRAKAAEMLKDILTKWPKSAAAGKARKLLEQGG